MSFATVSARCDGSVMSERLGVGEWMILEATCVILVSLFLLEVANTVKKHTTLIKAVK